MLSISSILRLLFCDVCDIIVLYLSRLECDFNIMVKAIFVDMDGTLLGKSQVAVSQRNMAALEAALDKGVYVIPCTGRVYDMLPPQILTHRGIRYFVTSHGARVYDRERDIMIYEELTPAEQAAKLMELLEGKGLYNEVAANGTIYLEKAVADHLDLSLVPSHHHWYIQDGCYTAVEKPSAYFRENNICIEKMNLYNIPENLQREVFEAVTATGFIRPTRFDISDALEFSGQNLEKARAMEALLNVLGIGYEDCLAIGDSATDRDAIQACGIGVAMGNASEDVKAVANYITATNDQDGFAEAIEKFVLREESL